MHYALRIVPASGLALLLTWSACGCSGSSNASAPLDGGAASADAGITRWTDASVAACDHYFAAQYSRCGGPVLPASETLRLRTRFEQVCENQIALPGSGVTVATLQACASALDASACQFPEGPPVACNFHGSLPGGAPCNDGLQCQSGTCSGTALDGPGGQIGPFTCGTCEPFAAVGQVCARGDFSAGCASDALCLTTQAMQTAAEATYVCVALAQGDVGAACDGLSATCKTGLYCAAQTGRCAKLAGAGAPCGVGARPRANPGGCAAPLACVGIPGTATCGSGAADAFCLSDDDCSPGLGCTPGPCSSTTARIGCSASGTCALVTWVAPGRACDGYRTRCLVGSCNVDEPSPPPDAGIAQGTCPTVVPDGQPCVVEGVGPAAPTGPTCDTFAQCFAPHAPAASAGAQGKCTLLYSTVCR